MVITGGMVVNFHDITKENMLNGSGLRTVLWVSGCEQHCPNCQNPQTHPKDSGIPFDEEAEAKKWNYAENAPTFREIVPGHFIYCNDAEMEEFKKHYQK